MRWLSLASLTCAFALLGSGATTAQPAQGAEPPTPCVDVEVNGHRIPAYACLAQFLAAGNAPSGTPLPPAMGSNTSNRRGEFSASGFAQRMGANLGKSVEPYRPRASYNVPLAGPGRP